jgi:quinol monooxygenase YgiN
MIRTIRFEAAFATAIAATRDEAGMIAYDLNRDENHRTQYVVYERWRTLADLERHLRTPYIQTLIEETNASSPRSPSSAS